MSLIHQEVNQQLPCTVYSADISKNQLQVVRITYPNNKLSFLVETPTGKVGVIFKNIRKLAISGGIAYDIIMSVRMRHTKSHTANRRSHHALVEPRLSVCSNCSFKHMRHKACGNCGQYRGREVIDVAAKLAKKEKKIKSRLNKSAPVDSPKETVGKAEKETSTTVVEKEHERPLNMEDLSKK